MKLRVLQTTVSVKQMMRLKNLEKSGEPICLTHIVTDHLGNRYEMGIDFGDGFTQDKGIEAMNKMIQANITEGSIVSIELVSIGPIPDRSEYITPVDEC